MIKWVVSLGNGRLLGSNGKACFVVDDAREFPDRASAETACLMPEVVKIAGEVDKSPIPVRKPG
jgi:hypothetical protein